MMVEISTIKLENIQKLLIAYRDEINPIKIKLNVDITYPQTEYAKNKKKENMDELATYMKQGNIIYEILCLIDDYDENPYSCILHLWNENSAKLIMEHSEAISEDYEEIEEYIRKMNEGNDDDDEDDEINRCDIDYQIANLLIRENYLRIRNLFNQEFISMAEKYEC